MEFDLSKKYSHRIQINSLKSQRIVHCNCSSNASQKIFSKLITRSDEIKKQRQPHNDRINLRTGVVEDTNRVKQQEQRMLVPYALIEQLFRHRQVDDSFCLHFSSLWKGQKGFRVEKDDGRFQDNYQTRPSSSELGSRSKRVSK